MPLIDATDTITLVEGSTFCISDPVGNIAPRAAQGLFVRDTRVVSGWRLRLADRELQVLSVQHGDPFAATFVCTAMPDGGASATSVVVVRERYVGNGMREDITVRNTSRYSLSTTVSLSVAADFADIFEVKAGRPQTASGAAARPAGDRIELIRRRGEHELGVIVRAHPEAHLHDGEISWNLDLPPRGQRTLHVEVSATRDGRTIPVHHPRGAEVAHSLPAQRMRMWRESSPQLTTADLGLAEVTRRSVEDLGALRIFDPDHPKRAVVAAGAPWYMALFGRDSLLTSWMVLPLDAGLALGTVETLAERQGRVSDQDSEEEPGRILHETRVGVAAGELALGGRNVYYGTADATPLFVMLLGELHRWGHTDRILQLLDKADRALLWITDFGDPQQGAVGV